MRLSEDRISHIAHKIWDGIYHDDLVDYPDDTEALQAIKAAMTQYFKAEDEIDEAVRQKIATLKRDVAEGSREWDILFNKYFEEESIKRGF